MDFVFTADSSQFQSTLKFMRQELEGIVAWAEKSGDSIEDVMRALNGESVSLAGPTSTAVQKFKQYLDETGASSANAANLLNNFKAALESYGKSSDEQAVKTEKLNTALDAMLSKFTTDMETAPENIKALFSNLDEMAQKAEEMQSKLGEMNFKDFNGDNVDNITKKLEEYKNTTEQTAKLAEEAYELMGKAISNLEEKQESLKNSIADPSKSTEEQEQLKKEYEETTEALEAYRQRQEEVKAAVDAANEAARSAKEGVEEYRDAVESVESASGLIDNTKAKVKGLTDSVKNWATGNGKFTQGLGAFKDSLNKLPIPLGNVGEGVMGVVQSMRVMMATPLGRFLALITGALGVLTTWFKKSSDGQIAFAKISAYVGSIVDSLVDIFIELGKYVYEAFFTADGAMYAFSKGLVNTLGSSLRTAVNLIEGLGKSLYGLWLQFTSGTDMDQFERGYNMVEEGGKNLGKAWDSAKDAIKGTWDTAIAGMDGFTKIAGDGIKRLSTANLDAGIDNMLAKASQAYNLAGLQKDAERSLGEATAYRAEMEAEIAKQKEKIVSLTGKEKLAEIAKLKAMEVDKLKKQIDAQKNLVAIAKAQDDLHSSTLQDEEKMRKMNIDLLKLRKEQNAALLAASKLEESTRRALERKATTDAKKAATEEARLQKLNAAVKKAEAELAELLYQQAIERQNLEASLEEKVEEARIASLKEGAEKRKEERDRQHKKELEDIEKQRNEEIEKERKRQKDVYDKEYALSKAAGKNPAYNFVFNRDSQEIKDINSYYDVIRDFTTHKQKEEEIKRVEELIKSHQSLVDKKIELDRKYQDEVNEIQEAINSEEKAGNKESVAALKRTLKELEKEHDKASSDLKFEELKLDPEYIEAFEDLGNASSQTLDNLIRKFEEAKEGAAKNLTPDQLREYTDTIQQMRDELQNRDPFSMLVASMKKLGDARKNVEKWQDILVRIKGNEVVTDENGVVIEQTTAEKELYKARKAETTAANALQKSIVACGDKLGQFGNMLSQLGSQLGGKLGDAMGAAGGVLGSIGDVMSSVKNYDANAKGISAVMGKVSLVTTAASAMVKMNAALDSLLPDQQSLYEHYARKQAEINKQRQLIMDLEMAQLKERLDNETWFYSNSLSNLKKLGEQNREFAKQYAEVISAPQEIYQEASSGLAKWAPVIIGAIAGIIAGALTFGAAAPGAAVAGATIGTSIAGAAITAALGSTMITAIGAIVAGGVSAAIANVMRSAVDSITYKDGQTAASNNLRVQTRHRTAFRSEKTQDLESWVKDNWGQELYSNEWKERYGVSILDVDVAKKLLGEEGPTLVGETRETLEKMLELSEKLNEFKDQVRDYVSEAFAPLVDDLANSLWDWLRDGKDVMDSFREYAADTFKSIADDTLKIMANKILFEPFQKQLEDLAMAYGLGELDETYYIAAVASIAGDMQNAIQTKLPTLQNAAEVMQKAFEGVGIDILGMKENEEAAQESTDNLRDTFVSALKDMGKSTDDFRRTLQESLFDELVEDLVLDDEFNKWFDEWKAAYKSAVESGDIDRMTALLEQNVQKREELSEKTKQIAESIGMSEEEEEISNSLDNLADTFMDTLLNMDESAEDMGKQIANTLIKEMLQTLLASEKYSERIKEIKAKWQQILNGEDVAFTMDDVLKDIADLNNDIANDESISTLANQYKELNKVVEKTETVFSNLRSTFLNMLSSFEGDAESFRKTLEQTMLKDFIEKQVLDVPITVNGMDFDDFNTYVEDWNERYAKEVKEGNIEAVDALLDELVQVREITLSQADDLRKRLEESMHTIGEGFGNLRETFVNTLKNVVGDAESLGKEIGQSMMEQMLNAFVEKQYSDRINAVNEEWAIALEEGDPRKIEEIRQKVVNLYETIGSDMVVKQLADDIKALTDTGTTPFDNLRSSYLSALTDMNKSTEDFTREISQMIAQSFVDSFVLGDMFDDRIEAWKKKYKDITTDAGLSEEERMKQLRGLSEMIAAERESMQGQVSDIYKLLGINDHQDQEATMSLAEAATYDQFELYLGIATAQQIALEQGNAVRQQILTTLQMMGQITSPTNPTLLEVRNMFFTANEYLLDIKRSNREILDSFSTKLDSIYGKLRIL